MPLKFVLFNLGNAITRRGGMLSLGPPVGDPICAQPEPMIALVVISVMNRRKYRIDVSLIIVLRLFANITSFNCLHRDKLLKIT